MVLNASIHYVEKQLYVDQQPISQIIAQSGTPTYIYSLPRALANYQAIKEAFAALSPHIHYSAKANANLAVLRALINAGAGIDAVSGGEIYRALKAGATGEDIVFAGVGKSIEDIRFAIENGVGWFNVENVAELDHINTIAASLGRQGVKVALRLNPDVQASTHHHIATGHGKAKFGLAAPVIRDLLQNQANYPQLSFAGIHIHIGSQLHDTQATQMAMQTALDLIGPYATIRTVNIGGGLPAAYHPDETLPDLTSFAQMLTPLLKGYTIFMEPGRSIIADAGILICKVLYIKEQSGQRIAIIDASMTDLIRPALYQAYHHIVPIEKQGGPMVPTQVVGPVCETTDILAENIDLPATLQPGDELAILTAGAYGMVMASNYNARPRPAEIVVKEDGENWQITRQRETWEDLLHGEI